MRIAIIDDEPNLIKLAGHTISDYGKMNSISIEIDEFLSASDFLKDYVPGTYSIVFMDVFMPGLTGVEAVNKMREVDPNTAVIFLTTSESHMKDALSCHAFDYLVKPATRANFFKVLDDCINFLGQSVFDNSKYIEFKSKGINVKLSSAKIIYVVSNGHFVTIATNETSYDVKETFSTVSDNLIDCNNFILVNRGVLINMDYIDKIDEGCCHLTNGEVFAVKIKGTKSIQQAFKDYKDSTL